jgi:sulfite exporter TauE/SafE
VTLELAQPLFGAALVAGLLGSGHCIGMCGGIVAALSLSGSSRWGIPTHILYHTGRVATYTGLGLLAGRLGLAFAYTSGLQLYGRYLMIAADGFVILVGLGSAGAFRHLNVMKLEFSGPARILTRWVRHLQRLPAVMAALPLGLILGLLPCGFLYAVLLNAALTADPVAGAQVMLGFGLGTAPALLLFGGAAHALGTRTRGWMLRGAGLAVALMGAYNLYRHLILVTMGGACCS